MPGLLSKTRTTLEMIKWEHSIFALPFALTAVLLAANGLPAWRTVAWILVAMVAARSCAMAFNRWADADLDAANPRTSSRAIPAGLAVAPICARLHRSLMALFFVAAARAQPAHPLPFAAGAGGAARLQLHEAHHPLVAPGAGAGAWASLPRLRGSPSAAASTRASWCSPRRSPCGQAALTSSTPARTTSTTAPPGLYSLPQAIGIPAAFWAARAMHLAMLGLLHLVRPAVSFSASPAGSASPRSRCCWPTSTPWFHPATCAA